MRKRGGVRNLRALTVVVHAECAIFVNEAHKTARLTIHPPDCGWGCALGYSAIEAYVRLVPHH